MYKFKEVCWSPDHSLVCFVIVCVLICNSDILLAKELFPWEHYPTGEYSIDIQKADLNNDGYLDLIVVNRVSDDVSVLLGDGNGGFSVSQNFSVGDAPHSAASADLNNDGNLDLVVSNYISEDISVLLGNGRGGFSQARNFQIADRPVAVATGDINSDGQQDVVVAKEGGSEAVSIMLGNGAGELELKHNLKVKGEGANSVALDDLDNDGHLDIAVTIPSEDKVVAFLGQGAGTFKISEVVSVGEEPQFVAVGDLDNDGYPDMVSANYESEDISVLKGDGVGGFEFLGNYWVGRFPKHLKLGDLDGNGTLDVLVSHIQDIVVLSGDGLGGFREESRIDTERYVSGTVIADFNRDEYMDIALTGTSGSALVILGDAKGLFSGNTIDLTEYPGNFALGDLNDDGHLDILLEDVKSEDMSVYLGDSQGGFQYVSRFSLGDIWKVYESITVADVNADNNKDVVLTGNDGIHVLLGDGTGRMTEVDHILSEYGRIRGYVLIDLNADNHLDIFAVKRVYEPSGFKAIISIGEGTGQFSIAANFSLGKGFDSFALGDVNGDGLIDVVEADWEKLNLSLHLGEEIGSFNFDSILESGEYYRSIKIVDLNADGNLDVVAANNTDDTVDVLIGDGAGRFAIAKRYRVGGSPFFLELADLNNDTYLDAVIENSGGMYFSILLGEEGGGFGTVKSFFKYDVGRKQASFALGDFNGDELLDIFRPIGSKSFKKHPSVSTTTYSHESLSVLEQNSSKNEISNHESPANNSIQSGVGLINGWACDAKAVSISIDDGPKIAIGYGTAREDTKGVCGDSDNGYGMVIAWGLLGSGMHNLKTFVDGKEISDVDFEVVAIGSGFEKGFEGEYVVQDFPTKNQSARIAWSEAAQNFVVTGVDTGSGFKEVGVNFKSTSGDGTFPDAEALVGGAHHESPGQFSIQSGIGLINGWACDAKQVTISIDGGAQIPVAYGTSRNDTEAICGDSNNGFGMVMAWGLLGNGVHHLKTFVNGQKIADVEFEVVAIGSGFERGLSGEYTLPGFPVVGESVVVRWSESDQNFKIIKHLH